MARLELDEPLEEYLRRHGRPIRYGYVPERGRSTRTRPSSRVEPGSAEMPSAGRPFTTELVTELVVARHPRRAGHAAHRRLLARARRAAVPRALPRAGDDRPARQRRARLGRSRDRGRHDRRPRARDDRRARTARSSAGEGWTSLVVTPERGLRAVDGLLSGWHDHDSSHLQLLEAAAGAELLERSYRAAIGARLPLARVRRRAPDPAVTKPRLVGINHVALEVGDIDEALAFYEQIFEIALRGRMHGAAFIEIGDQFIALMEGRSQPPDRARHFGLVVDDKEALRRALEAAGAEFLPGRGLDFLDPWGNFVQIVQYDEVQFTKPDWMLRGMGLDPGKTDRAPTNCERRASSRATPARMRGLTPS